MTEAPSKNEIAAAVAVLLKAPALDDDAIQGILSDALRELDSLKALPPSKARQPSPLIPGRLVTDRTAYTALGISRASFWGKVVKSGAVVPIRFGPRTTRFSSDDVLALMQPATTTK